MIDTLNFSFSTEYGPATVLSRNGWLSRIERNESPSFKVIEKEGQTYYKISQACKYMGVFDQSRYPKISRHVTYRKPFIRNLPPIIFSKPVSHQYLICSPNWEVLLRFTIQSRQNKEMRDGQSRQERNPKWTVQMSQVCK